MKPGWTGARVYDPWARKHGTVEQWEPLGSAMNDALVKYDDGSECWTSTHALRPIDTFTRQTRAEAITEADERTRRQLETIRADLVNEIRTGPRWDGCDFGKAIVGMAIDRALKS